MNSTKLIFSKFKCIECGRKLLNFGLQQIAGPGSLNNNNSEKRQTDFRTYFEYYDDLYHNDLHSELKRSFAQKTFNLRSFKSSVFFETYGFC